jgi:LacI family transcriptional regulator
LGGNPNLLSSDGRLKGYQQAFSQLKVKFDPLLVVPSALNRRGGFDGVQKLLKTENPPTAVLCFNDAVALGAMEGIQRLGRKPGVDFGIVGFNNIPDAHKCVPGLIRRTISSTTTANTSSLRLSLLSIASMTPPGRAPGASPIQCCGRVSSKLGW